MSRRDLLIKKLADTMDRGNAVALLNDVMLDAAPDFGLLTRRVIQCVVAEWPYYASNACNDGVEALLREAWCKSEGNSAKSEGNISFTEGDSK